MALWKEKENVNVGVITCFVLPFASLGSQLLLCSSEVQGRRILLLRGQIHNDHLEPKVLRIIVYDKDMSRMNKKEKERKGKE